MINNRVRETRDVTLWWQTSFQTVTQHCVVPIKVSRGSQWQVNEVHRQSYKRRWPWCPRKQNRCLTLWSHAGKLIILLTSETCSFSSAVTGSKQSKQQGDSLAHLHWSLNLLHSTKPAPCEVLFRQEKRKNPLPSDEALCANLKLYSKNRCKSMVCMLVVWPDANFSWVYLFRGSSWKIKVILKFLFTPHTKSSGKSSSLCPTYILYQCMYFCSSQKKYSSLSLEHYNIFYS